GRVGRGVAVKVLPVHAADDPKALARFEREARAVAALSHPNVLALHDFGREDGYVYTVSELLEGETLRQRLRQGPIPVRKVAEWGAQVARGLAAAHDKGIVHRDLKPENLFLTRDGRVTVLDFGVAFYEAPIPTDATAAETMHVRAHAPQRPRRGRDCARAHRSGARDGHDGLHGARAALRRAGRRARRHLRA